MNPNRASVNVSLITAAAIVTVLLAWAPSEASAQTYTFPNDSQGWKYMGLYDGDGLTPLPSFSTANNPWAPFDGDGGSIVMGQDGTATLSPSGSDWLHGDLNSPKLAYSTGRSFGLSYEITGSHMDSTTRAYVQAVILLRRPTDITDRRIASAFHEVPLGDDGAWETHTFAPQLPAGTIVKQISLRIFLETSGTYNGWVMVDNVSVR